MSPFLRGALLALATSVAAGLGPGPARAGIDDVEVALARMRPAVLDWDPAERVALSPGGILRLHLAAGKALRLVPAEGAMGPGLSVWVGDGNGIRRRVTPDRTGDALFLPETAAPRVVDLSLAREAPGTLKLLVSVGETRRDMRGHGYERTVPLPLEAMRLSWREPRHRDLEMFERGETRRLSRRTAERETRDYWVARPGQPFAFAVDGPTRLRIETRLLPEAGGALHRPYRVDWAMAGRPMRPLEFEGTWDLRRTFRDANGTVRAVARPETAFLTVPGDAGPIRFEVSRPMLIRVDRVGGSLASPKANTAPGYSAALGFASRAPARSPGVDWGALGGPTRIGGAGLSPEDLEHQARRLARTNALSNGAMVAADMMAELAAEPGMPGAVERAADRLSQVYGYFRDLHPVGAGAKSLETLHDAVPALLSPGESAPEGPAPGIPSAVLSGLETDGAFYRAGAGARLDYVVFDPGERGRMRILVDRRGLAGTATLRVVPDTGAEVSVLVAPVDELPATAYARAAEAGDGAGRKPGSRAGDFGALEFDLPGGVSRVGLVVESAPQGGLLVALQARQSGGSSLDAPAFRGEVARLGADGARTLLMRAIREAVGCEAWHSAPAACLSGSGGIAAEEVYNDLVPLLRLLRSRDRLVFDGVIGTGSPLEASGRDGLDGPEARQRAEAGDALLAAGHPLSALEEFALALRRSGGALAERIVFRQIAALEDLGETFLADRMLRRLALECNARAIAALGERFGREGDDARLLGLEVRRLVCTGGAEGLGRIAGTLAVSGQAEMAVKLLAVVPEAAVSPELAALAAGPDWSGLDAGAAPVPGAWVGADSLVTANAGAVPVSIPARGLAANWHRAAPGAPVRIRAHEDGALRLRIRPVQTGFGDAPGGAVVIETGRGTFRLPVGGAAVSEGLVLVGARGGLGTAVEHVLPVARGETVLVRPEGLSVTVEVDYRREVGEVGMAQAADARLLERLQALVRRYRSDPFANADVLPAAARLAAPWFGRQEARDEAIDALWREIESRTDWERVSLFASSAGMTSVATDELQFVSPRLRARAALSPTLDRSARALSANRVVQLNSSRDAPGSVSLRLALSGVPGVPVPPARVVLTHPDGGDEVIALDPSRPVAERRIDFGAGVETARLRLEGPLVNAFVTVRLAEGEEETWEAGSDLFYEVATASEPVVYRPSGPEVLRIDEWRDTRILSRFEIAEGEVVLSPSAGQERALYRVYRLVPAEAEVIEDAMLAEGPGPEAVPDARARIAGHGVAGTVAGLPALAGVAAVHLEPGGPGTWQLGVAAERRGDGRDGSGGADRFLEFSAVYLRHWSEWDLYTRSEILARSRADGPPTFGLRQTLTWPDRIAGFDLELDAALYLQRFDETAYRLRLSAGASRRFELSETVSLRTSGEVFFNRLSHDAMPGGRPAREVDRDVYSDYLRAHGRGMELSFRLDYQPYDDLRFYAAGLLRTNDDFSLGTPDQMALELGWDHQVGDFYYRAFVERRFLPADADRGAAADYTRFGIGARWDLWRLSGDRVGLEARVSRRSDRPGVEGALMLTWSLGGGFEDHVPGSVGYRGLREQSRLGHIARSFHD